MAGGSGTGRPCPSWCVNDRRSAPRTDGSIESDADPGNGLARIRVHDLALDLDAADELDLDLGRPAGPQLGVGGGPIGPRPVIGVVHEEDIGLPLIQAVEREAAAGVRVGLSPDAMGVCASLACRPSIRRP